MSGARRRPALGAVLLAFALTTARAFAEARGPAEVPVTTKVGGDVSLYVDEYDVKGNSLESPFEFTGVQSYVQLNLRFERRTSPYRVLRGQFIGIANDNDYRSPYRGVVTERVNLFEENGSARLPHRLELGDTYAFFTQRTIQRTLKGGQFEVQAPIGQTGLRQSLQIVAGNASETWRELRLRSDFTTGVSWLLNHPRRGSLGLAYLDNVREGTPDLGAYRRDQRIASIAGELPIAGQHLVLEGEASHLEERRAAERSDPETALNGEGLFLQLGGRTNSRVAYRARFESYEDGYRPAGSPIISDRRSGEAYVGWRSLSGLDVRGRFLHYRDAFETTNSLETTTSGVTVSGPLVNPFTSAITGVLDVFVRDLEQKDLLINDRTATASLELARVSGHDWTPRVRFFYQHRNDETAFAADTRTTEVRVGSDHALSIAGFAGTLGPAVLFRQIRDHETSSDDLFPALTLNLVRGSHSVRQSIDFLRQDRLTAGFEDVDTLAYQLAYRYSAFRNDIGVEIDTRHRDPSLGSTTRSLRAGIYWTRRFDHDFGARPVKPGDEPAPPDTTGSGRFAITELRPGMTAEDVSKRLAAFGIRQSSGTSGVLVYDTTVEPAIDLRQQVVTVVIDGVLSRAAVTFNAHASLEAAEFLQTFERFRRMAFDRYGRADTFLEEGTPTSDLRDALDRGSLYRQMQWSLPGGVLRLGIPRRLDGSLTFELQFARTLPPERDLLWSAIDLRN